MHSVVTRREFDDGRTTTAVKKTYGVLNHPTHRDPAVCVCVAIMKFAFLCVVIIISCSVCASGDLEIYPGLKFDLSSEEQRQGLADDNTVDKSPLYRKWPLLSSLQLEDYREPQEIPKEPDFDFPLPLERFRNLERLLKANRLRDEEDLPLYYDPKGSEEVFERYPVSSKIPRLDRFDELRFNNPSVPILDDVRPYPQDDDFTFGDEEEEEEENNVMNEHEDDFKQREPSYQTGGIPERIDNSHESQDRRTSGGVYESRTTPEASGRGALDDAKMVDDPTQFAYSPSDIRFFQNAKIKDVPAAVLHPPPLQHHHQQEEHQQKASSPKAEKLQQKNQQNQIYNNNKFHVTHRSDQQQQQQHEQQTVNVKFAADEFDPDDLRRIEKLGSLVDVVAVKPHSPNATDSAGMYIIATVAGIGAAAIVGLIAVGIGWYNLQKHVKSASDVDYPAYGVTGPNKDTSPSSGDRRLAQSAQMYHYQHQKQQIIAMESRAAAGDRHGSVSEADSDEENEEGDYTVYECPGLAPTGEMEVKNPLFQDDPTPAQTPPVKPNGNDKK